MRNADRPLKGRLIFSLLLIALTAITAAIYWPGMHGPVLLDDTDNLLPVSNWLEGQIGWHSVVFGNKSGLFGRPVSMASFLLDAAATRSMDSFSFKPTNLVIHVLCGLAMFWVAVQVFRRWEPTREHARWTALALAVAWLWLPLNVDTVLYIVQRMAQLAALFMLLALGCYMVAREQITRGLRRGYLILWFGVPVLTALAGLSKENGVLALPLALVLEWFLFRDDTRRRPASIKLFFVFTVGLPVIIGAAWIAVDPAFITASYTGRSFTLAERLLTEPRALWAYVQTLLIPLGPRMGFFQDNFPASTGPLHPWTTLPALVAWVALAIASWMWRKRNPLFATGVFLFLVGQSLESGPFALELYFEHRNYLPSFGVLLAVAGLMTWAWRKLSAPTPFFRTVCGGLLGCLLALYAAGTWGHVQSWRNNQTFFFAQNVFNPTSPRFQSYFVSAAIEQRNLPGALEHIAIAERYGGPELRPAATLWRFLAHCTSRVPAPDTLYDQLAHRANGPITVPIQEGIGYLANNAEAGCQSLFNPRLETILKHWLDTTPTPPTAVTVWQSRFFLARIVAASGRLEDARAILNRTFRESEYNGIVGILLFQINGSLGNIGACRAVLAQLEKQQGRGNHRLDRAVASFRKALAHGVIRPTAPSPTNSRPKG